MSLVFGEMQLKPQGDTTRFSPGWLEWRRLKVLSIVWMWSRSNSLMLPVVVQLDISTSENCLPLSVRVENTNALLFSKSIPSYILKVHMHI